ncbi:MAG TPA: protein kinase [Gemmatimonadaceae bacterium]|nr:protein kinase [Gemmatimonadaceae bacterium]
MDTIAQLSSSLTGRYTVEREIGAGGMATVYLARDVRHNRRVALKVLKPELGALLGVERFLSEIQVTANLQHPNLLPLFDSGEANGLLFYVMPFVEGENLRARLEREKQLPVDEAIRIAVAVASALDYAHRHGVIHRDLKPENILLHDGQPVVADFGIALAVSNAGGARITQTGLSLGTPQYMSPEQAAGDRVIDGRSDIYSLGAVTYEMLAGEPPHAGNTVQAIIARVLTDPVKPVRLTRPTVPEHVDDVLEHALAKLPADRWPTAGAFATALGASGASGPSAARRARRVPGAAWGFASPLPWAAAFGVAALIAAWGWTRYRAPDAHVVRFTLQPAPGSRLAFPWFGAATTVAISPDGRQVVYSGTVAGGGDQLFLQSLDELRPRPLAGTDGAKFPEFSPNGRWLAFVSRDRKLQKVPVDGGATTTLCEVGFAAGLTWLSNETLVFARFAASASRGMWRVSATGGEPQLFSSVDSGQRNGAQWFPRSAGDERLVFYTSSPGGVANTHIGVASAESGKSTVLKDLDGTFVLGLANSLLLYVSNNGALMAAPFDARSLRAGPPVPIVDSVALAANVAAAAVSVSSGSLAYIRGSGTSQVVSVDEHGQARVLLDEKRPYAHPRLSPDGRRIAFDVVRTQGSDIWVYDLMSRTPERLTSEGLSDRPEWTPDGKRVLYSSNRKDGRYSLWWQAADASAPAELLYAGSDNVREGVVAPDGRSVVYREDTPQTNRDVYLLPLLGERKPLPLLTSPSDELMPRVSPDGKWLAYVSDESGQYEIYVRPFPGAGGRVSVSAGGGMEPVWSPDSRHVFYRSGRNLVDASATASPAFVVTGRKVLFEGNYEGNPYHANYDVTRDGKNFIMIRPADDERQLVVVLNWRQELRQRTSAKR